LLLLALWLCPVAGLCNEYFHVAIEITIPTDHVVMAFEPEFAAAAFAVDAKVAAIGVDIAGERAKRWAVKTPVVHFLSGVGAAMKEPKVHLAWYKGCAPGDDEWGWQGDGNRFGIGHGGYSLSMDG